MVVLLNIDQLLEFRKQLWKELDKVAEAKGKDYSGDTRSNKNGDTFRNIRICEQFGLPAEIGIMVRLSDKFNRIFELLMREWQNKGGAEVKDEAIEDTLQDMINYASYIIAIREEKKSLYNSKPKMILRNG
jgi:hypothetical protein